MNLLLLMKAKKVNEVQNFERGGDPTTSLDIGERRQGVMFSTFKVHMLSGIAKDHNFTLVCKDLREIATYARVDNAVYRILKAHTPGPYTFILPATREVPRRLQHPKRKTIGLRVPDNPIAACLLEELAEPIMSVTLILPGQELPLADPYEIEEQVGDEIDLLIDGGNCGFDPTTIVDFVDGQAKVLREGKGVF